MADIEMSRQATVANVLMGLRRDILLGRYEEASQISETEVANEYQVSRSSVRSAFQLLERDGLIEVRPNGRKLVRKIDEKYIEDLCITRSVLECKAVELIIHQQKTDFSELLKIVGEFYTAYNMPEGKERSILLYQVNERFHDQLFVLAGNSSLMQCRKTIAPLLSSIVELNASLAPCQIEHGFYESHKKITEMLMERDEEVIEYIRYHVEKATLKDALLALQNAK